MPINELLLVLIVVENLRIYHVLICDHCTTSFCTICTRNHLTEPEAKFDSKYLGGHKLYPKPLDTKVFVFSDRLEVEEPSLRIAYNSMSNIENADEKEISARPLFLVGLFAFAWKKKHTYTIIEYMDGFNEKQTLIFDFAGKLEEAQQLIYKSMLACHSAKDRLNPVTLVKLYESKIPLQKISEGSNNVFQPAKTNNSSEDPLHILKIRLAKGEISKEEYEEMGKMIES